MHAFGREEISSAFLTNRFLLSNQCLSHSSYIYLLYLFNKHVEKCLQIISL